MATKSTIESLIILINALNESLEPDSAVSQIVSCMIEIDKVLSVGGKRINFVVVAQLEEAAMTATVSQLQKYWKKNMKEFNCA